MQETLKKLWEFNQEEENWEVKSYAPGTAKKKACDQWGGGRARRLLGLAYTIAFTCLLRVDEVLKIQSHEIVMLDENKLELTLPFRKTSQFGSVSNFTVFPAVLLVLIVSLCRYQAICDTQVA
jgi:hypothetical protein